MCDEDLLGSEEGFHRDGGHKERLSKGEEDARGKTAQSELVGQKAAWRGLPVHHGEADQQEAKDRNGGPVHGSSEEKVG